MQPGIVLDQLNRQLAPHGMMYAPDPTTSSRACVGGGIGNNTCGAHSVIYGKSLDHIMEVDVILADGTQTHFRNMEAHELEAKLSGTGLESDIYRGVRNISQGNIAEIKARYPNIMRRVSGYNLDEFLADDPFNLTKMVVGSEGTLCVVTEAKVNLVPRPTMTALSILHFSDIVQASEAIVEVLAARAVIHRSHGQHPAATVPGVSGTLRRSVIHRRRPRSVAGRGVLRGVGKRVSLENQQP